MNDKQLIWEVYKDSREDPMNRILFPDTIKDSLIDKGFVDNNNNPPEVNLDGTVTLYHNTKREFAKDIIKTKDWKSKEGRQIFFSTKPNGQITGYGPVTLKVNVDPELMVLDDIFDDEIHVWIDSQYLKKYSVSIL